MFMQIAIGAIGIGVVLMVGYLVVAQVKSALPVPQVTNSCYNTTVVSPCVDNTSLLMDDPVFTAGTGNVQTTVYAGFALLAVGIIVLAAFGLISIFR